MKRLISLLLAITLVICLFPTALTNNASAAGLTLGQLKAKFPQNKYWNHCATSEHYAPNCTSTSCNNPDGWTDHPCQHNDGSPVPVGDYDCNNFNTYGKSWQCCGFARKLAYDVYEQNCYNWTKVTSKSTAASVVKPGDVIHYTGNGADSTYGHWVFVIGVSGTKVTVGECNWGYNASDRCRINWGRVVYISNFSTVTLYRAPSTLNTSDACSHSWTAISTVAATCTAKGYTNYRCSICGTTKTDSYTNALGHNLSWTTVRAATCTVAGERKAICTRSGCSYTETASIPALGHSMRSEALSATCSQGAATRYYCDRSGCAYSYTEFSDSGYSEWSTEYPENVGEASIRTRTEYRYSDYQTTTDSSSTKDGWSKTGESWAKIGTGSLDYAPSWYVKSSTDSYEGVGISTSNSVYQQYNKPAKTASETETAKTEINSNAIIGYVYYHWCKNEYTTGPINRIAYERQYGSYNTCHAFYAAGSLPGKYDLDNRYGIDAYYKPNASCCKDSYWFYAIPVYRQTWTTYAKQYSYERWTDWSDWSADEATTSGTRKVETRTVYSYQTEIGNHVWDEGAAATPSTCTTAGETVYTCTLCGATKLEPAALGEHTYVEQAQDGNCAEPPCTLHICTVCGDSYKTYADETYSEWTAQQPEGVSEDQIRTRTEYRYSDYQTTTDSSSTKDGWTKTGESWIKTGTGSQDYVPSWYVKSSTDSYEGVGISTSNSVYQQYNKPAKTASEMTEINSNAIIGYVYYHWCKNEYTAGPINRTAYERQYSPYNTCHAFYAAGSLPGKYDPDNRYGIDAYYKPNASCCKDSYWYYAVPVYRQTWTTYAKQYSFERWTDWSDWSADEVTASDTRKVETRTVYSYVLSRGEHSWGEWQVTAEPTCTGEGTQERTCAVCNATETDAVAPNGHTWDTELQSCTVCGAENPDYVALAVRVGSVDAIVGTKVTVPVTIENNTGIAGFTFTVDCDEAFTLTNITKGALLNESESGSFVKNINGKTVTWYAVENLTGDGTLFTLTFDISPEATPKETPVAIHLTDGQETNFVDENSNAVALRLLAGSVNVTEHRHVYSSEETTPATCTADGMMTYTCLCGDSYTETVPARGHKLSYTDNGETHTVTCANAGCDYSVTEAHTYTDGVCVCGAAEKTLEIASAALVLNGKIDVAFTVQIPEGYTNARMIIDGPNGESEITKYSVDPDENRVYVYDNINPQCMGDLITATLYATKDGVEERVCVENYSVRQYCVNMLSKDIPSKLRTLLSDMLAYGAAAQTYMDYKTGTYVNAGDDINNLTYSNFSAVSDRGAEFAGTAEAGLDWVSAGLTLTNSVAMNFRFRAENTDGLTIRVSIEGREQSFSEFTKVKGKTDVYEISFTGISANEFGDDVTAVFYRNGSQAGRTILYRVNTYIANTQDTDTAALRTLVRALYSYGASAEAYTAK